MAAASIVESAAPPLVGGLVFVIGNLSYDFGTEARRDTYLQRMPAVDAGGGILVPPNPTIKSRWPATWRRTPPRI